MHRDTVKRSRGPLSSHSSTTITSCFRRIMHGSMSQGSVHNSWKLKMSHFFHGLHTYQTCHPLSMFGMLWIYACTTACSSSWQYPVTFHSHWRGGGQHSTSHNQEPDQLYAKEMSRCMRHIVVTSDTDWFSDLHSTFFITVSVNNRCMSVFPVTWNPLNKALFIYFNWLISLYEL